MKKAKVVIASVLKPVTDTRAFGKLAISLRETNKYHINIIGFLEKKTPKIANIEYSTIFSRHRLHPFRFFAPLNFAYHLAKYKPDLVIVTTYELLLAAAFIKKLMGFKLIYDIQENYTKNIQHNHTLPNWLKTAPVKYIQFVEKITNSSIDQYFFAEQCYVDEFPYISNFTVLENKYAGKIIPQAPFKLKSSSLKFVITGTISPVYGSLDALYWFKYIQEKLPQATLEIIGHVPLDGFKKTLENTAKNIPNVLLNISKKPIPQSQIYERMKASDILLLPYQKTPSIWPKIPTKIYEALALGLPVIIPKNKLWESLISPYPAGVALDFLNPEKSLDELKKLLETELFLTTVSKEVLWEAEKKKLQTLVAELLNN
ncbi:glycosyltransferase [Echinicola sp. 20G]|uniref:glycosyltransferase n=1 Tax=Echinicola sp. 20G TaxID=2781961 RepID=UPI001F17026A|nr:glycosyltransferase [Echinicola sp. 20G]